MSGTLAVRESPTSQAVERLSKRFQGLARRNDLIMALMPNISLLNAIRTGRRSPNIIRVTVNKDSFSPGDIIQGTVKLMLSEKITVQQLVVQLGGESKSSSVRPVPAGGGNIFYNSFFTLLDESTEITMEQTSLSPKIYEFPFQISIPRISTTTKEGWPYDEDTFRFNNSLTQPLPGSFKASSNISANAHCKINYFVIARLISDDGAADIKHKIPLNILITDSRALTAGNNFHSSFMKCSFKFRLGKNAQALAMSPSSETPPTLSLRTKDKLQDTMLSFKAPSYSFDLDAKIPRFGRISQPLKIVLKLSWLQQATKSNKQGDRLIPSVDLKSVRVELQSLYMFRGTTTDPVNTMSWSVVEQSASYHVLWRSAKILIAELKDPVIALKTDTEIDIEKMMFVHPRSVLPAFTTWNISRDYTLLVTCDLECASKSFQAKYTVDKFDVLPGEGVDDDFFESRPAQQAYFESESENEDAEGGASDEEIRVGGEREQT